VVSDPVSGQDRRDVLGGSLPTASTRVCAVIGDPVAHSLSPVIHNAGYAATGLDWVYVAFPVIAGNAREALSAMRTYGIQGLSVTMPHKQAVFEAVDSATTSAQALTSCNTVFREDDRLIGDSTDGEGCLRALAEQNVTVAGAACVVIGAGGAGRAVIAALARADAGSITVINRDPDRGLAALALGGPRSALATTPEDGERAARQGDILINATSLGMHTDDVSPIDPRFLHAGQIVNDLIYHPLETSWLRAAREVGCHTMNGTGMLLHQATLQFERWTGLPAPIEAMRSALDLEIARRDAALTIESGES
jgi:shikimate dehydrogenase